MALCIRKNIGHWLLKRDGRILSSLAPLPENKDNVAPIERRIKKLNPLLEYRFSHPEFLPDPKVNWRNKLREKLERTDMLKRRNKISIPEFYVGSILAVTISDPHAQGKTNKFVGICIERKGCGLRADFTLRNVVDHQGVEVRYDMYDPTIQSIQVLRLEKRLDDNLLYLRDCLPEYSTFPFDMEPELQQEGAPVPVNPIQVKLKPKPWVDRWERRELKGVSNIEEYLTDKERRKRELVKTPWEKYDLMKDYRKVITEEEQIEIWSSVHNDLQHQQQARKKMSRKRTFSLPKPLLG